MIRCVLFEEGQRSDRKGAGKTEENGGGVDVDETRQGVETSRGPEIPDSIAQLNLNARKRKTVVSQRQFRT